MKSVPKVRFLTAVFVLCFAPSWGVANSRGQSAAEGSQAHVFTQSNVARTRAEHLRHEINLSEWFARVYNPKAIPRNTFRLGTRRKTYP
jgi:hypothetical protein